MVNERVICCCGASSWTRVISWLQIVGNIILLIVSIVGLVGIAVLDDNSEDLPNKKAANAALVIASIFSLLGLIMGIILLKGTNEKRVGFLRAWFIYGIVAGIISIIILILNTSGSSHSSTVGSAVFSGILGIGINVFSLAIVYIHMKEINEGVFIP